MLKWKELSWEKFATFCRNLSVVTQNKIGFRIFYDFEPNEMIITNIQSYNSYNGIL